MPTGLKMDLKQLSEWKDAQLKQFQKLTQNFDSYEKRVKEAVHQLDLKSQQARKASETRLKEVSVQIQKTRGDVERRVKSLLEDEAKKLNVRLRDIYSYLVKVAQKEQKAAAASAKSGAKKKKTKSAKAKTPRKSRAKAVKVESAPNENLVLN